MSCSRFAARSTMARLVPATDRNAAQPTIHTRIRKRLPPDPQTCGGPVRRAVRRGNLSALLDKSIDPKLVGTEWRQRDGAENMQTCGVHYAANATASSSFAGRQPG